MKFCKDCEFFKVEYVKVQQGKEVGMAKIPVCTHSECADPIFGEPIAAEMARKSDLFCTMKAKYFKLKEVKPISLAGAKEPKIENVIQLK